MNKYLPTLFLSVLLIGCTSQELKCVETTCVHTDQAVQVSKETKEMYRRAGYRVPVRIPPLPYPEELRIQSLQATLVLSINISEDGDVTNAKVESSTVKELFDQAAIKYVKKFKFESSNIITSGQLQRVTYRLQK